MPVFFNYFISFMVVILLSCKEDDFFAVPVFFGHPRAPFSLAELLRLDLFRAAVAEKPTYGRWNAPE